MGIEFNPNIRTSGLQGKQIYKAEDAATLERPVLELVNAKPRKAPTHIELSDNFGVKTVAIEPLFLDLVPTLVPKKLDKITLSNSTLKTMEQLPKTLDEFKTSGMKDKARAEYFGTKNSEFNNLQPFSEYLNVLEQGMA